MMPSLLLLLLLTCLLLAVQSFRLNSNLAMRLGGRGGLRLRAEPDFHPDQRRTELEDQHRPLALPMVDHHGKLMDITSRLLADRIIMIGRALDDDLANAVVAQLLHLSRDDPTKDITMYLNCPGGAVSAGMAIFDIMRMLPCDVSTVCYGTAASMGAFLLAAGAPGKRRVLPNAHIVLRQPMGSAKGQAADIELQAAELLFVRAQLNGHLAAFTGQSAERIEEDSDRDFFLTAEEAKAYGLVDEVITKMLVPPAPAAVAPSAAEGEAAKKAPKAKKV